MEEMSFSESCIHAIITKAQTEKLPAQSLEDMRLEIMQGFFKTNTQEQFGNVDQEEDFESFEEDFESFEEDNSIDEDAWHNFDEDLLFDDLHDDGAVGDLKWGEENGEVELEEELEEEEVEVEDSNQTHQKTTNLIDAFDAFGEPQTPTPGTDPKTLKTFILQHPGGVPIAKAEQLFTKTLITKQISLGKLCLRNGNLTA